MKGKPTIWDVARLAGVSPATVSRVLNGKDSNHISEKTRKRVLWALEELDYVPDKAARSLRRQKSELIAVLIPDVSNPFFASLARGVECICFQNGLSVMICDSNHSHEKEGRYLDILRKEGIDGLVFVPVDQPDEEKLRRLERHGIFVVVADRRVEGWPVVEADNKVGSSELTRYVLESGYRRIAYIAGPSHVSSSQDRVQGFIETMSKAGLEPLDVKYGDFTFESGYLLARELLAMRDVDFIMCGNDLMAIGALRAAAEKNIKIPLELGIAGFDHIQFADLVHPPLTTVEVPAFAIGVEAVRLLLASTRNNIKLPTKIVPGGTCVPKG